jgi:transcriptional regulator with XRE-family HTH domain
MEKIDLAIANVLKNERARRGFSQEELAFQAGLHRTYISQLERNLKSVTLKTLFKITQVLNIEIDEFTRIVKDELTKLQTE